MVEFLVKTFQLFYLCPLYILLYIDGKWFFIIIFEKKEKNMFDKIQLSMFIVQIKGKYLWEFQVAWKL